MARSQPSHELSTVQAVMSYCARRLDKHARYLGSTAKVMSFANGQNPPKMYGTHVAKAYVVENG
jgi:hypothetical protein